MHDDYYGSAWAEHHGQVSVTIHKLARAATAAFVRLFAATQGHAARWRKHR